MDLSALNFNQLNAATDTQALTHQRDEWLRQRLGKFTASQIHRLMTSENKPELSAGAETYVKEKLAEQLTQFDPDRDNYTTSAMQWGNDYELEAIDVFTKESGLTVTNTGNDQAFITSSCGLWGGTPDGIIKSEQSGIEVKCAQSKTHMDYLLNIQSGADLKKIKKEYYWQIQASMVLSNAYHWYFVSYDPRFVTPSMRLHTVVIKRNDKDIQNMYIKLNAAKDMLNRLRQSVEVTA